MRAVLDVNVLISALLSRAGAPARLLGLWLDGEFELVVSPPLLAEAERALKRPKLRERINAVDSREFIDVLRELAEVVSQPEGPAPFRSADPDDDYLLALAAQEQVVLVSGDEHLLALRDRAPVLSPRQFLDRLESEEV